MEVIKLRILSILDITVVVLLLTISYSNKYISTLKIINQSTRPKLARFKFPNSPPLTRIVTIINLIYHRDNVNIPTR